jgi:hypothetical protein
VRAINSCRSLKQIRKFQTMPGGAARGMTRGTLGEKPLPAQKISINKPRGGGQSVSRRPLIQSFPSVGALHWLPRGRLPGSRRNALLHADQPPAFNEQAVSRRGANYQPSNTIFFFGHEGLHRMCGRCRKTEMIAMPRSSQVCHRKGAKLLSEACRTLLKRLASLL